MFYWFPICASYTKNSDCIFIYPIRDSVFVYFKVSITTIIILFVLV